MPLDDTFAKTIYFVGYRIGGEEGELKIKGTAFLMSTPSNRHSNGRHYFFVTAGHLIKRSPELGVVLRGPHREGGTLDLYVENWATHPTYDISIAPAILPRRSATYDNVHISQFVDDMGWLEVENWEQPFDLMLGQRVYFVGFLSKLPELETSRTPVTRSGTTAALNLDDFPVRDPWDEIHRMKVHLIDCTAFGGFSGAPCFVEQSRAYIKQGTTGLRVGTAYRIGLLGLIGGHLDEWTATRRGDRSDAYGAASDDEEGVYAKSNRGIAHVIPAEHIREALELEPIVEYRKWIDGLLDSQDDS